MNYILSIETSTRISSVAVHRQGELVCESVNTVENSHAESIPAAIKKVMVDGKIDFKDLSAVAVSKGPGSYTGLRIGVSIAKGICYGNGISLIGINTLKSMALEAKNAKNISGVLCPMIDARRMEVYCQFFDDALVELSDVQALIIDANSLEDWVGREHVYYFGDGAGKCKEILNGLKVTLIEDVYPYAKNIGILAWKKFKLGEFENLAYFEPYYLKEFMVKKPSGKNLV